MYSYFVSGASQEFGRGLVTDDLKSVGENRDKTLPSPDDAPVNFRAKLDKSLRSLATRALIQEGFAAAGVTTLLKLDHYIRKSDVVIHLVGRVTGSMAKLPALNDLKERYPKFEEEMPALADAVTGKLALSYTQWEAYLAIYHKKRLFICQAQKELGLSPNIDQALVRPDLQEEHVARLKNLGHHVEISFSNADNLAVKLWQSFADSAFALSSTPLECSLPESFLPPKDPHPLYGREKEVEDGLRYLKASRLVTVHAPPGVGKTRVVKQISYQAYQATDHPRIYFFDLNYKSSADDVAEQIRAAFHFEKFNSAEDNQQQLGLMLNKVGPMLLVLDNFEQVGSRNQQTNAPKVAAQTVKIWLECAPELRLLVGSRRRLELTEWQERCVHLRALPVPSVFEAKSLPAERLREFLSVRLFISRAREHGRDFGRCTDSQLRSLAHIVAMTGGFPSPLVIASSRLIDVSLEEIEERMASTFIQPEGEDETVARAYLYTQLDQLFETLMSREQRWLLQASQFRQGFDFKAATAVFNPDDPTGNVTERQLESVLHKLLLAELLTRERVTVAGRESTRYGFYLPIEEWAADRWADDCFISPHERGLHYQRCIDYFCSYFELLNTRAYTENSAEALDRIRLDRPNLTECHDQACERRDIAGVLRGMQTLFPSLHHQGPTTLLQTYLERTLAFAAEFPVADHVDLLDQQAMCFSALGRWDDMFASAKQALMLAESINDLKLQVRCQVRMHTAYKYLHGERDTPALDPSLGDQLLAAGDLETFSFANKEFASFSDVSGEPDEALQIIERALRIMGSRYPSGRGMLLNMGGIICWHDGRCREAVRYFRAARPLFHHHGPQNWPAGVLTNLGFVYTDLEKFSAARYLHARADEQHRASNNSAWKAVNDVAIARLYLRMHEYKQAIVWCERVTASVEATQYHANKAMLSSIYAAALFKVGRLEEADRALRLALERMRPNSIKMRRYFDALVTSADCAMAMGNFDYARECLDEAETVAKIRRIDTSYAVAAYRRLFERMLVLRSQLNQTVS